MIPIYLKFLSSDRFRLCLLLLFIAGVGLSTVQDYGISWDEAMEIDMVRWHWDYATKGIHYPVPLIRYYGVVFNGFCELIYLLKTHTSTILTSDIQQIQSDIWLDKINLKHLITFLWTFAGYIITSEIVCTIVTPKKFSDLHPIQNFRFTGYWITPLILALFPRFWGHSFFNPKDIPFAVLFTATTLVGARLTDTYLDAVIHPKITLRRSFFYGILVGLLGGIRPVGIVTPFLLGITYFLLNQEPRRKQTGYETAVF